MSMTKEEEKKYLDWLEVKQALDEFGADHVCTIGIRPTEDKKNVTVKTFGVDEFPNKRNLAAILNNLASVLLAQAKREENDKKPRIIVPGRPN
jgi:hypothetical protein